MLFPLKLYFKDRWVLLSLVGSGLFFVYILFNTIRFVRPTSDLVFLHYNIIFGVDLIGEWWKLYLLPAVSLIIIIVNFLISYFYYRSSRFVARFLAVITLMLQIFLTVATTLILGINA